MKKIPGNILQKIGEPTKIKGNEGIAKVKYDLTPYGILQNFCE